VATRRAELLRRIAGEFREEQPTKEEAMRHKLDLILRRVVAPEVAQAYEDLVERAAGWWFA
jgi:hypothetical protein